MPHWATSRDAGSAVAPRAVLTSVPRELCGWRTMANHVEELLELSQQEHEVTMIPVDQLHFDPQNPRLLRSLHGEDEEKVLRWMLDVANVTELMGSIGEQGYFSGEPLMCTPRHDGGFTVVEGNRRLAAVRLLRNPGTAPVRKNAVAEVSRSANFKPDQLPAIVYGNREEVLGNLGFRHVTGIQPWPPLAKARYVQQLRTTLPEGLSEGDQLKFLARSIGSRSDYVAGLLSGIGVYDLIERKDYFNIKGLNEETMEFSIFTTALGYSNIAQFVGMGSGRDLDTSKVKEAELEELTQWLFEKNPDNRTRIGESRNLAQLNRVLGAKQAAEAFREGRPLTEAILLTGQPTENFEVALREAQARLEAAQDQMKFDLAYRGHHVESLGIILRLARSLKNAVEAELKKDDDED